MAELRKAGLEPNDVVVVTADGAGRIVIERYRSIIEEYTEKLSGTWPGGVEGFLEWRKREWEGRPRLRALHGLALADALLLGLAAALNADIILTADRGWAELSPRVVVV